MQRAWIGWMSLVVACSVPQPELPEPPAEPEPPTYRDPADLPGPHSLPEPSVEPEADAWQPMDPSSLEPLAATPCNPGLAPIFAASPTRDMGLATQVHGAALGCLEQGMLDEAATLAASLTRDDSQPDDAYIQAKVALARWGGGGETACVNDVYLSTVLERVVAAASPQFSARMMVDPAFEPVRTAYRYRVATLPGEDRLAERLVGTLWHGPGQGAFGTMTRLAFAEQGQAVVHQAQFGDDGMPFWTESPATWSVEDDRVNVVHGERSTSYAVDASGQSLSADPSQPIPDYLDHPSECEA